MKLEYVLITREPCYWLSSFKNDYIIPGIPPMSGIAGAGLSSFMSLTVASVVNRRLATDVVITSYSIHYTKLYEKAFYEGTLDLEEAFKATNE